MRYLLLLTAVVGCADDSTLPSSKSETRCEGWGNDNGCDLACADQFTATQTTGPACNTSLTIRTVVGMQAFSCPATIDYKGEVGCCWDATGNPPYTIKTGDGPDEPGRTRAVFFVTCE